MAFLIGLLIAGVGLILLLIGLHYWSPPKDEETPRQRIYRQIYKWLCPILGLGIIACGCYFYVVTLIGRLNNDIPPMYKASLEIGDLIFGLLVGVMFLRKGIAEWRDPDLELSAPKVRRYRHLRKWAYLIGGLAALGYGIYGLISRVF